MKILVAGGAGFIGSNFVRESIRMIPDAQVTVLDKLTYAGNPDSLNGLERTTFIVGDIADHDTVDPLVSQADLVINFAAESHNDRSLRDPARFIEANILGTFSLLEAVRRHRVRYHHISTDEVYGDLPLGSTRLFTPASPYAPSSPYSASKASADHLVRAWLRSFGIEATISNCSNNYGPYQHIEKFIPRTITNLLDGIKPRLYGSGRQIRDWIHVADHVSAVWTIIKKGNIGQTYLIGAQCERTNLQIAAMILEECGLDPHDVEYVADRPGHDQRYAIDNTSILALGWKPQYTDIRLGLRETIHWYHTHEEWWRGDKQGTEHDYHLTGQ